MENCKIAICFLILFVLGGCSAITKNAQESLGWGEVNVEKSKFDDSTTVFLTSTPVAYLENSNNQSSVRISHTWNNQHEKYAKLTIYLDNYYGFDTINTVSVNINGEIFNLRANNSITDRDYVRTGNITNYKSSKSFIIPFAMIELIASNKTEKALIQINTQNELLVNDLKAVNYGNISYPARLKHFLDVVHEH